MGPMAGARLVIALAAAGFAMWPPASMAQEQLAVRADLFFYGDNTEFHNPFREGETIFGAAIRLTADLGLSDRVRISLGGFGNQRFGSERSFDLARPVIALTVAGRRSLFTFGTLPGRTATIPAGPDRQGPHDLLPPLQRETLAFDRPYEAGLQWSFTGATLQHELWLEWQRVNTPAHRERFDGGLAGSIRISRIVSLPLQVHVVHEGGQLYASGPVRDSAALAAGVSVHGAAGAFRRVSLDVFGVASRYVPDRSRAALGRDGAALLARASAEREDWRGHLIVWRGRDFIKDEGDPNYLSLTLAGARYRGTRDYAEAGLARRFRLAPGVWLEVSGRLHRIERYYEYSYRVVSGVVVSHRFR
jgi:hypothetical protein